MPLILWILVFAIIGSVGATVGGGFVLLLGERYRRTLISSLVSYAAGTLLGSAFLGMMPKGLRLSSPMSFSAAVLAGLLLFFLLEKLVIWRHCHVENCETHTGPGPLILIGDAFHNLVDGVVIAAAFLSDIHLGIVTSVAVIAHEVPQEMGDFAILLQSSYTKRKAFLYNILSSMATVFGAIIAYFYLKTVQALVPFVLAISAASFIYISLADLVPGLHRSIELKASFAQFILLLAGIGTIAFFVLRQ